MFFAITNIDTHINALLLAMRNPTLTKVFEWITLLGEIKIILIFTLIISVFLWSTRQKWQMLIFWLVIVGSESITWVGKLIFNRPRPLNAVLLENSASFPSGHATIAAVFYGFLAYLFFKQVKSKLYHFLIILFTIIIILVIGFSRLYLGVHYFSDVFVGYLVGLLWLIVGIKINENKIVKKIQEDLG